ncbi:MAG: ABC transporter ATP-binding protein [Thiohalospira sp.]
MTPETASSDDDPVLLLKGVHFAYPDRPVLCGVDLRLRPGSIHGLLGPNGAGKTTLFRLITGRLRPDSGTIRLLGHPPEVGTVRRHLGWVPQTPAIYPHLTVRENLEAFARLWRIPRASIEQRVADALTAGQLEQRADDRVAHLSGGYQQRVNIAVALVPHPRLLLLDEPTSGVDSEARAAIQDVLLRQAASGTALLLTTHDSEEAERLCDHFSRLEGGRLATREATE